MLSLSDREWEAFLIGDLFSVSRPVARNKDDYVEGDIPFVASGSNNNGVMKYCSPLDAEDLDKAGCITVSPVDGSAFYQPIDFLGRGGAGSSILMLRSNHLNDLNGLFIAKMIANACSKYTYGHMGSAKTIVREQIMLPVKDNGNPDWQFMEDYIRERKERLIREQIAFLQQEIEAIGGGYDDFKEQGLTWQAFSIGELFHTFENGKGKGLNHLNKVQHGGIEYIGATNRNDGVLCFVDVDSEASKMVQPGNCIGFIRNGDGSAGYAIYREGEFISTSDVMYGYADWLNESTGRFFVVAQDKIKAKYSHGHKRSAERLKSDRVMLPVDADGNPNWSYMEQYEKRLRLKKLNTSRRFLDEQLSAAG